jgi:hypothetical protein
MLSFVLTAAATPFPEWPSGAICERYAGLMPGTAPEQRRRAIAACEPIQSDFRAIARARWVTASDLRRQACASLPAETYVDLANCLGATP